MTEAVGLHVYIDPKGREITRNARDYSLHEWLQAGRSKDLWEAADMSEGPPGFARRREAEAEEPDPNMAKQAKKPKDQVLVGMEDSAIPELEKLARQYAEIRDQRMDLNEAEVKLKAKTLQAMKKHGKDTYKRAGVTITVVHEEEGLKVRVKDPDAEKESDE